MNSLLTKSYLAGAIVNPCRFVKHGAADYAAIQASDAAAAILGVSVENLIAASGQNVDVIKEGLAYLELGDAVTRGDVLVPDANGKGIPAVIVAGNELHAGAVAEVSGAAGDIIPVQVIAGSVIATDTKIISADIVVTSAQLLALNAVPKDLVAAPGANKALVLEDAQLLKPAGTAYAGIAAGEDLSIKYTGAAGLEVAQIETTGFLDQVDAQHRHVRPLADAAKNVVTNAKLVLHLLVGEITTGDSDLKVRVRYRIVDTVW